MLSCSKRQNRSVFLKEVHTCASPPGPEGQCSAELCVKLRGALTLLSRMLSSLKTARNAEKMAVEGAVAPLAKKQGILGM